ncbi:MAG: hypothetical protein M1833_006220 [Piccolia ochrophora]|nr:MAG: hypothetical protein M1833_006220 [Piccolia ochrophora]
MPNYTHGVCEYQCIPELSGLSGTSQTRGLSNHFKELTKHGQLSVEQALDIRNVPFITIGKQKEPAPWGVLRIKNIPFNVTKNEIYAFLGHSAHYIDGAQGGAIHIIMERTSGKTVECFVEFQTLSAANRQVIRWRSTSRVGRHQLLGKRFIVLELSSQEVLMAALFPKANCVEWQGQKPVIRPNTEAFSSGFKGFVTQEELVMMVKHAEAPNHILIFERQGAIEEGTGLLTVLFKTKFARKSPQRVYECLLSTLAKFPWSAGDLITLETRDGLFNTTQSLLKALKIQLKRCSPLLTSTLFRELVTTALQVPGFTEFQKSQIAHGSGNMDDQLSPLADAWPFVALGKIDDAEEDVVRLYASMLKEATTSANLNTLYQQASSVQRTTYYNQSMARTPFGNFYVDWPANRQKMTLAQAAELEWGVLDATLRKALRPANEQISPQNPFAM